jgi:NDP-sugar pyrophosphorylase family protein
VAFPIREYWLDIGRMEHYQQAQEDVDKGDV